MEDNAARMVASRHRPQSKIMDYLTPTTAPASGSMITPKISFIDLPQHIREKVYDYAGIGGDKFIDLNFWNVKEGSLLDHEGRPCNTIPLIQATCLSRGEDESPYWEPSFPFGLLTIGNRLIYREVQARLYAHNTFAVSLTGPGGLQPLEGLSDAALRELRVLIVSLRPCKCLTPFCSKIDWRRGECAIWPRPRDNYFWDGLGILGRCQGAHMRPLRRVSRTDKATLARWQQICARLASVSQPRQLQLYLTAKPGDAEDAHAILEPLRGLPELKDIAINLGTRLPPPKSIPLARDVVLGLTNNSVPSTRFRFLDLPTELQIQVLNYTRLASEGLVFLDPREKQFPDWGTCHPELAHPSRNMMDFCSMRNPGAFSLECECRDSPLPFFLASKAFAEVARAVFYGHNEFRLLDGDRSDRILGYDTFPKDGYYELTLPAFLHRIPQRYISLLTHVTIVFPPMAPNTFPSPGVEEWEAAIALLKQAADLPRLKLEIHFSDQNPLPDEDPDPDTIEHDWMEARRKRNPELERAMLGTYRRFLEPLKMLGPELRAFLVYVPWPLCKSANADRRADETMLERMVMGDEYDATRWGKCEESLYSQPKRWY